MTLPLWPQQDLGPVRRGDIFALGRHRLACIDATDKAAVARLFGGQKPTLVVTSPPYADARDYNDPIPCWDSMMLGALDGHDFAGHVQMLVNLGGIHRKGEWVPYWQTWLKAMRKQRWKCFGQYVWDKLNAFPGNFNGRPGLCHEYIFHLNKLSPLINKTVPCKGPGRIPGGVGYGIKGKNNAPRPYNAGRKVNENKIMDSVIRLHPEKTSRTGHPAVFPLALPRVLIAAWAGARCLVYDPFGGSGTTLLACEAEHVDGVTSDISPAYVQIAIDRWRQMHPDKPVTRITAPAR